jgi:hypothetical protein
MQVAPPDLPAQVKTVAIIDPYEDLFQCAVVFFHVRLQGENFAKYLL